MSLNLSGTWKFRLARRRGEVPAKVERWMEGRVPGTVHGGLERAGKIADPWFGMNELDLQWIDRQDWEWMRTFAATAEDCARGRQDLIFDGLDTVATVFVNGRKVGRSVNMFRQVVCDVRGVLKEGENEVRVVLESPTEFARKEFEKGGKRVAAGDFTWVPGESRETWRAWIRKTQCHFGWDWGVYLATSGIWQDVRLECGDSPRIAAVTVEQEHIGEVGRPGKVRLKVRVHLDTPEGMVGVVSVGCVFASETAGASEHAQRGEGRRIARRTVDFAPQGMAPGGAISRAVSLRRGEAWVELEVMVERPKLWWPNGQGEQPLYDLHVHWRGIDGAEALVTKRIGLRTLELVREADKSAEGKAGESFYFRINGRPVFAKGANWIPADQFVEKCTPGNYRHLLGSMAEANMNMVRVWGGGWYEQESFYDLCDEMGILVWQDMMMACALYPDTKGFMAELEAEAVYQVRRLQSRACVAIWCGDNECMAAVWEWWAKSPDIAKNIKIYTNVLTALRKAVEGEDVTRVFWLSSPSNNAFDGHPGDPNRGDVHYWKVWHQKAPFSDYLNVKPRFASEFGFQSFPEPRTIRAVIPPAELNPSSRVMEHHQRSPDGNMLITNTMAREMPLPRDLDMYCWVSQINQAMAMRTAVEHWRRLRPWCMGTIYWQLNDLWPVASWSSLDYHGRWKVLQHFAGRFFAPLLGSLVHEGGKVTAWGTSDVAERLNLEGAVEVFKWSGERVARRAISATLKGGESRALGSFGVEELLGGKATAREVCVFIRLAGGGHEHENFATLVPWKWAALPAAQVDFGLKKHGEGVALAVKSRQVVPFFHAELGGLEGHFAGDWQVLSPGRAYLLPWVSHVNLGAKVPTLAEARRRLTSFSLYDTYAHEAGRIAR